MFYFDDFNGYKVLRSDLLKEVDAFFTTREVNIQDIFKGKPSVTPVQTHSDHIELVNDKTEYPDTDSLIIKDPNKFIYLKFADCTPLIFYNPKIKIGAVSHAGWRGTAAKIGIKTIQTMGGNPSDIIALVGPAIGLCCYEVSEDVKSALLATVDNKDGLFNGRNVDLKAINAQQLKEIGVENIDISSFCTSCNNDLFYSYRKENGTKDRHYAVLKL